jgi:hypothetical protein
LLLIFIGIIFSTLITRGGGLSSLHAFTGDIDLIIWALIAGIFLLVATFLAIYKVIDAITEGYKDARLAVALASYLCLLILAFICLIGLTIPPLTLVLGSVGWMVPIFLNPGFYSAGMLVPALCLSISLSFCTLIKHVKPRTISIALIVAFCGALMVAAISAGIGAPAFNPLVGVYAFSMIAPFISIVLSKRRGGSFQTWFKRNAREFVHAGISCILIGTISGEPVLQEIMYIAGFLLLVGCMVPAIVVSLLPKGKAETQEEVNVTGNDAPRG